MASILKSKFREAVEKDKDPMMSVQSSCPVSYPTGLAVLDHMNGKTVYVEDAEGNLINTYKSTGIRDGSIVTFIGPPGSGKTTAAIQIACYIAKNHPGAFISHEDPEGGSDKQRIRTVGKLTNKQMEDMYDHRDMGVTTENFYKRAMLHCDMKKKMRDELMYDTGVKDEMNKPLKKVVPSFIILDSLASLMPEGYQDEEEMSGKMAAAQVARRNTAMLKRLIQHLRFNNVNLFFINHINTNMNVGGFGGPTKQLQYLKQDERVPGGKAALFYANNIFKLYASGELKPDELYYIDGFYVRFMIVKSRSNRAGQEFKAVFDKYNGFNNILTIIEYLKSKNLLKGAWLKIPGYESKFRNSEIMDKFNMDKEFRHALLKFATIELNKLIPTIEESQGEASKEEINEALSDLGIMYGKPIGDDED